MDALAQDVRFVYVKGCFGFESADLEPQQYVLALPPGSKVASDGYSAELPGGSTLKINGRGDIAGGRAPAQFDPAKPTSCAEAPIWIVAPD